MISLLLAIDYVLVGLDWAEPMMQFTLHVTCSCIFHAYVLHFNILAIDTTRASPSSSNPTPSHIRFCDKDARQAFSENFSR